jgi:HEAT repeat protein
LGKLGNERAVEPLINALGDSDLIVRRAAAEALAALGESKWSAWIKGDNNDFSRLGKCGDPRAFEVLIKALVDPDRDVCGAAAALGALGDARAVEPLIKVLGSVDDERRDAAAGALRKLGDSNIDVRRKTEEALRKLGSSNRDVRRKAEEALGKLRDARAAEPLIKARGDSNMSDLTEKLYSAAGSGNLTEVQNLLRAGADANARTHNGETALHSAAISGNKDVVELLLDSGADVNALNGYGETPLERAVYYIREYSNKETLEALRRHGGILKGPYANYGEYESYRRP